MAKQRGRKKARGKQAVIAVVAIVLVIAIVLGVCWYFLIYSKGLTIGEFLHSLGIDASRPSEETPSTGDPSGGEVVSGSVGEISSASLSIHFLELGNKYAGDCTLIKVGDTEVLIDAGSRQGSAAAIVEYVDQYCTDGVLEYVVATHADQDHISAFIGTNAAPGIFETYECETIIDFPLTNKTTATYRNYCELRDAEVEAGAVHYTALECWEESDGAKRSYQLSDDVTMQVLYNYYYENKSSDENNYSVCLLLTQGENNYLFTGDLEEDGEEKLVEYNELPKVKLFKAGHHGSKTSNNDCLLSVIQPEIVCVCCCAGAPEYTTNPDNIFPTQAMVDRVSQYTDKIYVTTLATEIDLENESWDYTSMNGNIVIYTLRAEDMYTVKLWCSNNDTILKDTEWFKEYRTWSGV